MSTSHAIHTNVHTNTATATGAAKAPAKAKPKKKWDRERVITYVGRVASVLSVIMYVSYIAQIQDNLAGHPGNPLQPLCAFFNCVMWTVYGLFKTHRDWPIVVANVPGIILGAATFATSFL